jgi:hypothetical protein
LQWKLREGKNTRKLIGNRIALGTPVANIIVLTAAVILATTVTIFASSVTTSQVQKENLYISKTHLWYVNRTFSVAAIGITNTGPIDIVLNKVTIKGLECMWNGTTSYVVYCKVNGTIPGDMPFIANFTSTGSNTVNIENQVFTFTSAGEDLTLKSSNSIMFYIALPERLMVYDLGIPVRIVIQTTQSAYCTETLVQST